MDEKKIKLIIQIPCYNEEETLPLTYNDLPKKLEGIDSIETLIIDDGSKDKTVEVAQKLGINHIISFKQNKGLAAAFSAGIEKCLELGADIIVNTDGDNQYCGADIVKLVLPVLHGEADVVVGDRQTSKINHFSPVKKMLQRTGSRLVRKLSATKISDAVSGFRAYSRETALKMNILTEFSYTIENLIQLGSQKTKIISVPIRTNKQLRKSRLFKSIPNFISQQVMTLLRVYANYKALKVFSTLGVLFMLPGIIGFIRFLYFYLVDGGLGHIQSLVFSAVFVIIGFILFMFGIIADMISNNRKLIEKILRYQKEEKWEKK